jgi:hypothetical protein
MNRKFLAGALFPSSRGGVAAPVIKCREATEAAQTGGCLHAIVEEPIARFGV